MLGECRVCFYSFSISQVKDFWRKEPQRVVCEYSGRKTNKPKAQKHTNCNAATHTRAPTHEKIKKTLKMKNGTAMTFVVVVSIFFSNHENCVVSYFQSIMDFNKKFESWKQFHWRVLQQHRKVDDVAGEFAILILLLQENDERQRDEPAIFL